MNYNELSREEQNKILRQHGYSWQKITQDWLDDNDDFETRPGWYLYSQDHREISVSRAFREIEIGVEAAAEEIRQAEAQELKRRAVDQALKRIRNAQIDLIKAQGIRPDGEKPAGQIVLDTQNIYGGGDWFVIGEDCIWYVRNNGMDGDNWSYNNVRTGGAGAIGWKASMDLQTKKTLLSLENGSLKERLLAGTAAPVPGYLIRTKVVDMNGEHIHEIGRTEDRDQVEEIIRNFYKILEYEGTDSVDREMLNNTEVLYDGELVGKRNPRGLYDVIWL
jgi:hypothetical protein